jgi:hypothetical protein
MSGPSPWVPENDVCRLKVLGKALEEGGEYVSAVARCLIQGIAESEPTTGKPNRQWLEEEMADVMATMQHLVREFDLDIHAMSQRVEKKYAYLRKWFDFEVEA